MTRLAIVVLMLVTACTMSEETTATLTGTVVAGPTCPVETNPPDPQCAPRVVEGAVVVAERPDGAVVQGVTNADGAFSLELGVGLWAVTFRPVEGLMGTPEPLTIVVDTDAPIEVGAVLYDTGIR